MGKFKIIQIDSIKPEKKDIDRALGFRKSGKTVYTNDAPFTSKASPMAKAITDPSKLIRRAKAVVAIWGTRDHVGTVNGRTIKENVWRPFAIRLSELGFTAADIHEISLYEHDDVIESLGLSDLF